MDGIARTRSRRVLQKHKATISHTVAQKADPKSVPIGVSTGALTPQKKTASAAGHTNANYSKAASGRKPSTRKRERVTDAIKDNQAPIKKARLTPPQKSIEKEEENLPASPPQFFRAKLTRKNLSLLDRMSSRSRKTGKTKESLATTSKTSVSTTKTSSTTASDFAYKARKNGILEEFDSKPPANMDDLRYRFDQHRTTASPPQSVCEDYKQRVALAGNEATSVVVTSHQLLKDYPIGERYIPIYNKAFNGIPSEAGFNHGLSPAQPDYVQGPTLRTYGSFPVEEYVEGSAVYKDDPNSVTLPHIAGEWKKGGGNLDSAQLQSAYDGASMVYARRKALELMGTEDPPGHASVTTFATDGNLINTYAHYAETTDDGIVQYHQYKLASNTLTDSPQNFKDGRRRLRNQQDFAREESYALRGQLTEYYKQEKQRMSHLQAELEVSAAPQIREASVLEDKEENLDKDVKPRRRKHAGGVKRKGPHPQELTRKSSRLHDKKGRN